MIGWTGAALLAAALALVAQWRMLPTADVSWLLHAAGRVLDGARIGRDLIDVNFPLVILDKLPAVAAARALGFDPWHGWIVCLLLLLSAALLLSARLPGSWFARPFHGLLAAVVLLAAPGSDFGQREHVTLLAVLPYVVLVGARIERRNVPLPLAAMVGALAAGGLAQKPFFVVVPLALGLLEWRRGRSALDVASLPEHLVIGICVPLIWLAQLAAAPGWLEAARWYWPLYSRYGGGLAIQLGVLASGVASLAIASILLWRWRARGHIDGEGEALAVGALGFFVCIVLQARSLSYHFVPVVALVALVGLRWLVSHRDRTLVPSALVGLLLVVVMLRSPWDGVRVLTQPVVQRAQEDPSLPALQRALGRGRADRRIAVLSTNPASVFPLLPSVGARTPFRQISLWPIIGLNAPAVYGDSVVTCTESGAWSALERHWRDEVAEDLQGHEVDALVVLVPDLGTRGWGDARRIDYLACLRRDERVRPLLDAFTEATRVGPYRVLRRPATSAG
jgi:hypothetical protein